MNCNSVSTVAIDAYEAGLELGIALLPLQPEVVILCSSIHYENFEELFDGLYDGLETSDVIIMGSTGDGYFEANNTGDVGIGAMGINSNGKVRWHVSLQEGVSADSYLAARSCATQLLDTGEEFQLALLVSSMQADGMKMADGIKSILSAPCLGGLAGDDRSFERSYILLNGKAYTDAVALLGMAGDFSFAINLASGWSPIGNPGVVNETDGCRIVSIDDVSAKDYIHAQFGKPISDVNINVLSLAAFDSSTRTNYAMRTPYKIHDDGSLSYFGSVEPGTTVQMCFATSDNVLQGANQAVEGLIGNVDFVPSAAIVVSCACRKWILGERISEEVSRIAESLPPNLPFIGYPSYGEFAPHRHEDGTYTETQFHNVTLVVLLLG